MIITLEDDDITVKIENSDGEKSEFSVFYDKKRGEFVSSDGMERGIKQANVLNAKMSLFLAEHYAEFRCHQCGEYHLRRNMIKIGEYKYECLPCSTTALTSC